MPQPPTLPSAGATVSLPVGQLLAWAEAHDTKFVVRKAQQARLLLRELRGLYAKDEERAEADAEEQRLLKQLEEVRARKEQLRPRRKSSPTGYDQTTVRAWARANGYSVADRGSIPGPVVEAWRASQTGGAR
ncbi:histone-like nucleoid-structuring protein Lsr2 [Streptomyces sp. NPDC087428]|uniref:Lsr2 family DNA-binding protein n=1 Tax=Streptomyces sp. NPDC087428 TaxID=3365788 RepID=UPI0037F93CDA